MSPDRMVFTFEQLSDTLILVPQGPFMSYRDSEIRAGYNEAYRLLDQPGTKHLLVDFSSLDYFGSTFVGILIRLARKVRSGGGQAAVCHISENMKDMLQTLMLLENPLVDFSWTAYPTREAALAALTDPGGQSF
jgi:anti-anti-sigma factor